MKVGFAFAVSAISLGSFIQSNAAVAAVIDDFSCSQVGGFQLVKDAAHGGPETDTDTGLACVAGGTRTLELFNLTGSSSAIVAGGRLAFDNLPSETSQLRVTWGGLGGVDLTAGGGTQFEFSYVKDGDLYFELALTDTFGGAGIVNYFSDFFSPNDGITPVMDIIQYTDIVIIGSLNFAAISTISLVVTPLALGTDSAFIYLQTNGTAPLVPPPPSGGVPVPGSLALFAAGLAGIGAIRRRGADFLN